ncbi:hypothetical protein EYZ11_013214 [Aspergillus tanneri]|uniref:Uncharacterized protein n=1 Tax=Aspergillus tanneri TaxID=1220188 RepID=A0A4S3IY87_9EURO|nr:hypothetical protein EYZ11_013214 [Aspergillus tanneri]
MDLEMLGIIPLLMRIYGQKFGNHSKQLKYLKIMWRDEMRIVFRRFTQAPLDENIAIWIIHKG